MFDRTHFIALFFLLAVVPFQNTANALEIKNENPSLSWQLLPSGLMWHSYLAGIKDARFSSVFNYQERLGWLWNPAVGGRAGFLRYGTVEGYRAEGWQLDVECLVSPELIRNAAWDMRAADFRGGGQLVYAANQLQVKFGFYHMSSHVGDKFLIDNPTFARIEYARDALILALGYYPVENLRLYGEADWAFNMSGVTKPWQFQLGAEYTPELLSEFAGSPFVALNAHLRQEANFGGTFVAQTGWRWLNKNTGTSVRIGIQIVVGKNQEYQFYNDAVLQYGFGLWYDF